MKYPITPTPKPRMTQRDKWSKRPVVLKYRAFCDECRLHGLVIPASGSHVIFRMPMPRSWSKKKRAEMNGQPHRGRPDVDNLGKSTLDAIYSEDSGVWDIRLTKLWAVEGSIEVISNDSTTTA